MEYVPAGEAIGGSRRSSSAAASSIVSVPTPSRDLSFRRGAYTHNILRLEQSAEEMSAGGSDIGEEIRRINDAERSRRSSVQSAILTTSTAGSRDIPRRSRQSSYANSILDLNNNARAGGYSPGEVITSPVGSVTSMAGKKVSIHKRTSTESRNSRLAQMMGSSFPEQSLELGLGVYDFAAAPSRQLSQSSYARGDDISGLNVDKSSSDVMHNSTMTSPTSAVFVNHEGIVEEDIDVQDTPPRPSSSDTFQQAQTVFHDFDGVHCPADMEEYIQLDQEGNEIRRISGRRSSGTASINAPSLLLAPDQSHMELGAPPPQAGMVFYPAPVPRMLNLPKRLSQLPAASVQAKRRSQAMSQMYSGTRSSAAWLSSGLDSTQSGDRQSKMETPRAPLNERLSVANFANVPPQLRASVFFEHQTVVHDVDVKSESAVATLDGILAASATAPVSAFTDHPYAGDVSKTLFAPARDRRSTATDLRMSTIMPLNNRRSNLSSLLKRASSSNALDDNKYSLLEPQSGGTVQARKSQISLAGAQNAEELRMPLSGETLEEVENESNDGQLDATVHVASADAEEDGEAGYSDDELDPTFIQPSTLLAELQVRKAQQKSRNRTAATAFPDGMHSTLLQLDAVAEIDRKKRQAQRVALAWEDPAMKDDDAAHEAVDDDVPLGMLFPNKSGLYARKMGDSSDWDRPLGLMEKRQMEDNEPLSSRRSRLRGEPIQRPRPAAQLSMHLERPATAQSDEIEGEEGQMLDEETLAQRLRRVSTANALDAAISDVVPKDGSRPISTFTEDVIGELNLKDNKNDAEVQAIPDTETEEETLGQRRARLQREKEAKLGVSQLLAANPIGLRKASKAHVPTRGTLLHANEQAQASHKKNMLAHTMRSSSYGPLAASHSAVNLVSPMAQSPFQMGMQTSASTPMLGMQNSYFSQPTMGMTGNGVQSGAMQPSMMNPHAYGMLTGQPQMLNTYAGMPGHGLGYPAQMGYGFTMQPTMQQRNAIDQWRLNIAQ